MKQKILDILTGQGIPLSGFCRFSGLEDRLLACRAKSRLPQDAKTVIVCAFPYRVKEEKPRFLSRYAAVPDYHTVCGDYLDRAVGALEREFPGAAFSRFVDNSPIPEVYAAACAGLGKYGKNGLLLTERYGSWVFLGEIVTDLDIPCENRFSACPGCGECERACPKNGAGGCLSAISQKKGELTAAESALLKKHGILWGCDLCADACPLNRDTALTPIPEFLAGYRDSYTPEEDPADRAYLWRGTGPIRRNAQNLA